MSANHYNRNGMDAEPVFPAKMRAEALLGNSVASITPAFVP